MIRLAVPDFSDEDLCAIGEVLSSGQLVQGERVAAFEAAVSSFLDGYPSVAVSSGTAALQLSLASLQVARGDTVIVPSYSFPATANVVELLGARPFFVEIEPEAFNMDVERLENAVEQVRAEGGTRVSAILPVHAFGQMADMAAISDVASRHDIAVVEDAACALGARRQGKPAGHWGSIGCFSFHPRKGITTGEGGIVVTADPQLEHRVRALRNHGIDPTSSATDFVHAGWNYRMTELQAALGVTQVARAPGLLESRRRAAARYDALLADVPVTTPILATGCDHAYQSYVVLLSECRAPYRDRVIASMREQDVEAAIGTWHIPLTTYYRKKYGYTLGDFPVTDAIFSRSLALPLYRSIDASTQERVVDVLRACIQ